MCDVYDESDGNDVYDVCEECDVYVASDPCMNTMPVLYTRNVMKVMHVMYGRIRFVLMLYLSIRGEEHT